MTMALLVSVYFSYGNTSSSSIWYEMDYIRKHMDLRRGQRVLQVTIMMNDAKS